MNGNYCDACMRNKATIHVTMRLELFSVTSKRMKMVQFWLCEECERNNRVFLENRGGLEGRVAKAMTPQPVWLRMQTG